MRRPVRSICWRTIARMTRPHIQMQRTFRWRHWSQDLLTLERRMARRCRAPSSGSIQRRLGRVAGKAEERLQAVESTGEASGPRSQQAIDHGSYSIWLRRLCEVQKARGWARSEKVYGYTLGPPLRTSGLGNQRTPLLFAILTTQEQASTKDSSKFLRETRPHQNKATNSVF